MRSRRQSAGVAMLALIALVTAGGQVLAPHDPGRQFADLTYAPPMPPRVVDADGHWRRPFVYPLRLVDRLERRFAEDRAHPVPLQWFSSGAIVSTDDSAGPWLPLGGDALGRDILARLVRGARLSLGVSIAAAAGALLIGVSIGAAAGYSRPTIDGLLMRTADFVLVLPAIYVVILMRSAMPLVMSTPQVFWTMAAILALADGRTRPRRSRHRPRRTPEGVRRSCTGDRGGMVANSSTPPASGSGRLSRRPGDAAAPGLHPGRSDAVVRRLRFRGT